MSGDKPRAADPPEDGTACKRIVEVLKENDERYGSLFRKSHAVMLLIDPETGRILDANPAAISFYGYRRQKLLSMRIFDLNILPEEQLMAKMKQLAEDGSRQFLFQHRLAYGDIRDVEVYSGPITVEGKSLLFSIVHDVTARRRAEEALRESEARYRSLYTSMNEGFALHEVIYDSAGNAVDYVIRDVNPAYEEITGLERDRVVGARASELYGTGAPPYLERFVGVAASGKPVIFETTFEPMGKSFRISVFSPLRGMFATVFEDITELKRIRGDLERRVGERTAELARTVVTLQGEIEERIDVEKALQDEIAERMRAMEELRLKDKMLMQQSRLAAMGEMIGNIAHQWRQPLNTLGLIVQQLATECETAGEHRSIVEESTTMAMDLIFHMSQTIDGFRNFFQPDKEQVRFSANQVVARTVTLIDGSFRGQGIRIDLVAREELFIRGYPNEFSQVLMNLLLNARDAFAGQTVVDPAVRVSIARKEELAVVTVGDNAGGIPDEIMDRIFDPYFTTKGPDKGTGIGLYMSKAIIEKNMNGRLSARNVGGGAEFRIEVDNAAI